MKKSIVYSQGLRIKRVCSKESSFEKHLASCYTWFVNRVYPHTLVQEQFEKVRKFKRDTLFGNKRETKGRGIPLIVTYHPFLSNFGNILRKYGYLLQQDSDVKKAFKHLPFVTFRTGYSFKNHLVRAKVPVDNREVGSKRCGKRACKVCNNVTETDTFQSSVTKESYKINFKLDCDDKCLVYLLTCNVCHLQYVGQTTDRFRMRWNNYKCCNRKALNGELVPQIDFHRHYFQSGHKNLPNDCSIILIDKTDPKKPCERETFWIHKLKTMVPFGLNTVESISQ